MPTKRRCGRLALVTRLREPGFRPHNNVHSSFCPECFAMVKLKYERLGTPQLAERFVLNTKRYRCTCVRRSSNPAKNCCRLPKGE